MTKHIESQYQCAVIQYCKYLEAQIPALKWIHCSLNGARLTPHRAARAKAEGMKAGIFDLFWPVPSGKWHGLYIEMKKPNGKLTDLQKEFLEFGERQGYCMRVAFDPQEAMKIIKQYYGLTGI